jgi:hypothetical protein
MGLRVRPLPAGRTWRSILQPFSSPFFDRRFFSRRALWSSRALGVPAKSAGFFLGNLPRKEIALFLAFFSRFVAVVKIKLRWTSMLDFRRQAACRHPKSARAVRVLLQIAYRDSSIWMRPDFQLTDRTSSMERTSAAARAPIPGMQRGNLATLHQWIVLALRLCMLPSHRQTRCMRWAAADTACTESTKLALRASTRRSDKRLRRPRIRLC